jgi:hypothetical protein
MVTAVSVTMDTAVSVTMVTRESCSDDQQWQQVAFIAVLSGDC